MTRTVWCLTLFVGLVSAGCRPRSGNACEGVPCSGHGKCAIVSGDPACACDEGYRPEGLNCLPLGLPVAGTAGAAGTALPPTAPPSAPGGTVEAAPVPPTPAGPGVPTEADVTRLCELALEALKLPEPGTRLDLATEAKLDAIARFGPQILQSCKALVQTVGADPAAVECGTSALSVARQEGITLGALGDREPAVAACGGTWQKLIEGRGDEFRAALQRQRDEFGVAVFGFHRRYDFRGGRGEEFCRRFIGSFPDAPPDVLAPGGSPPDPWAARITACGDAIDGYELRTLLRWCVVDRAGEILAVRSSAPCERYAGPEDRSGLEQLVSALVALAPAAPPASPPSN